MFKSGAPSNVNEGVEPLVQTSWFSVEGSIMYVGGQFRDQLLRSDDSLPRELLGLGEELLFICTGCQGDSMPYMRRNAAP